MVAQAVDFTISGQINRALVVRDTDASTRATVEDNGESDTRIRANGSTELDDGSTINIQFEYGVGGSFDRNASHASDAGVTPLPGVTTADDGAGGTGLYLRHANVQYRGTFGAFTLGQGSEAGDGSQYAGVSGVTGLAHGSKTLYGDYFGSLDSGARVNMIRYDTPDIGPVSAAVSVGNGDRVSAELGLSTEFAGSSFGAKVGTLMLDNRDDPADDFSSIGASFGLELASGLNFSGAWAKGRDANGMMTPGMAAMPAMYKHVDTAVEKPLALVAADGTVPSTTTASNFGDARDSLQTIIDTGNGATATAAQQEAGMKAQAQLTSLFETFKCDPAPASTTGTTLGDGPTENCSEAFYKAATAKTEDMQYIVDPSYVQLELGYKFGNTAVAASWYQSSDFVMKGSSGTAIGIGATHTFPKAGADVYVAVENFSVEPMPGASKMDGTIFMIGSKVSF